MNVCFVHEVYVIWLMVSGWRKMKRKGRNRRNVRKMGKKRVEKITRWRRQKRKM